jgi:hypothetical protein
MRKLFKNGIDKYIDSIQNLANLSSKNTFNLANSFYGNDNMYQESRREYQFIEGIEPVYFALPAVVDNGNTELSLPGIMMHLDHQHSLVDIEPCPQFIGRLSLYGE